MNPELDELRDADPARDPARAPEPDWDAMFRAIITRPRRRRQFRVAAALVPATALAAVVAAVVLVGTDRAGEPDGTRAIGPAGEAAQADGAIYRYIVEFRELEGPGRRPVADAQSRREGWVDPETGEIHESGEGREWASDGRVRRERSDGPQPAVPPGGKAKTDADGVTSYPDPAADAGKPDGTLLDALSRHVRMGPLREAGETTFEGRRVRRYLAGDPKQGMLQTFLVDAETGFPVLFRTETGDHLREGSPLPHDQRVMEERFVEFEALPRDADRSVLELSP